MIANNIFKKIYNNLIKNNIKKINNNLTNEY